MTFKVCSADQVFFENMSAESVQVMLSLYNDLHHDMKVMLNGKFLVAIRPEGVRTCVLDIPSGGKLTSDSPGKFEAIQFK